jgi:exonuclease VII small subunit
MSVAQIERVVLDIEQEIEALERAIGPACD